MGLFSVAKFAAHDRLNVNPVVSNSRTHTSSRLSRSLAPGNLFDASQLGPPGSDSVFQPMTCHCQTTIILLRFVLRGPLRIVLGPGSTPPKFPISDLPSEPPWKDPAPNLFPEYTLPDNILVPYFPLKL